MKDSGRGSEHKERPNEDKGGDGQPVIPARQGHVSAAVLAGDGGVLQIRFSTMRARFHQTSDL
jgi:hypothetical protein